MTLKVSEKTLYDLEWDRVTDALSGYAATLGGRARCLALPFFDDISDARLSIERVAEFRGLLNKDDAPSLAGVSSNVSLLIVKAEKGGILEISELGDVASTTEAGNRVSRSMSRKRESSPRLAELCSGITVLTEALDAISYAIDIDRGEIRDRASAELGGMRKRVRDLHVKIKRKLGDLLENNRVRPFLRDDYYTIREDRYVLPVKAQEKSGVKGIVHGSSGSGRTLFIEPREMVTVNNDLLLAQMEVEREERRILRGLSGKVAAEGALIASNLDVLTELDIVQAKARLADLLDLAPPEMSEEAAFELKTARHPLLVLKGVDVVDNDLYLGGDFKALVLSGANTGGKTVALKTMGLSVLMARAGMHIPAEAGSLVGAFSSVFSVMGDEQSLSDDLSTFSANILKLNEILDSCGEGSLILLDEIVVGTDPRQGAALAQAIVEGMAKRGARIVVTTHYDRLKQLAYADSDFANAAVGLSGETLKPTYKVTIGVPGSSASFRIAEELGVKADVVNRASELIEGEATEIDRMILKLQEEVAAQKAELEGLKARKQDLESAKAAYESKLKLLELREKREIIVRRKELLEEIRKAENEVRDIIRNLQKGGDMRRATAAMESLREKEREAERGIADLEEDEERPAVEPEGLAIKRKPLEMEELKADTPVYVASLNRKGVIVEPPDRRGLALVEVGRLKMRMPADRLRELRPDERVQREKSRETGIRRAFLEDRESDGDAPITCDLRGERVEEALEMADAFLDRALRQSLPFVYFIHGHGAGRLKSALREHFKNSPYVQKFRPGQRGEGSDGVTVVVLDMDET